MSPQSIAALVVALSAVGGCTDHEKANAERVFQALGASPVDLAETSSGEDEPIAPEPTYPVVAAAPVSEECISIFRVQTCEAGVLHHLNEDYSWRD